MPGERAKPQVARRRKFKGYTMGPLLLTACLQGAGAPILDLATSSNERTGERYDGWVILVERLGLAGADLIFRVLRGALAGLGW